MQRRSYTLCQRAFMNLKYAMDYAAFLPGSRLVRPESMWP
jgi:hypothetical protein